MDKRIVLVLSVALLAGGWLCWPREADGVLPPATPGASRVEGDAASAALTNAGAVRSEATADRHAAASATAGTATVDADAEPMGELLVHVVWADGVDAPGVRVYFRRLVRGAARPLAELTSDAHGRARAPVSAGRVQISSDRGPTGLEVDVVTGQLQEARLVLFEGVRVEGVVLDAAQRPVPGARIWLTSPQWSWAAGAFVAEADGNGSFALRDVPKEQSLGAVAPGFAPSKLVDLDRLDPKQAPIRVELVLGDAGGALAGRVVDAAGKPVAGALVAVGKAAWAKSRTDDTAEECWAPRRAATDAEGRYAIEALVPGTHPVEVWASAFAIWRGECTIEANTTAQLDAALLRGVTVHGAVAGEDGKPLAGAIVRALPTAVAETFLSSGQYDFKSTFGCPFAVTDDAGRYRLWRAAPGELHLYASPGEQRGSSEQAAWAHEVVRAEDGATIEWNPKIDAGATIRGVVRYRDGTPVVWKTVYAACGESALRYEHTDKQGRFRFVRMPRRPHDVSVRIDGAPPGTAPLEARAVWPDAGELELVAQFDAPKAANGSVSGAVSDVGGRLSRPAALIVALQTDEGQRRSPKLEGGAFRFESLKPGRMRIVAMSGEDPILFGPWFELQPAENKDLGTIVTEPGGKLRLRIVRGPGTEALEPDVVVMPPRGPRARIVKVGRATEVVIDNLCAGVQSVEVWGQGTICVPRTCTIVAGAEAAATIELRAAVEREFVLEYAADQRLVRVRLEDERGGEVMDFEVEWMPMRPWHLKLQVPLGRCRLTVETAAGGRAETTFEMASLAANQPPVVLQVK